MFYVRDVWNAILWHFYFMCGNEASSGITYVMYAFFENDIEIEIIMPQKFHMVYFIRDFFGLFHDFGLVLIGSQDFMKF